MPIRERVMSRVHTTTLGALALVAVGLVCASSASAVALGPAKHAPLTARGRAEHNVLRALAHGWGTRRISALFDRRTHLLRNNTQAICHRPHGRRSRNRFVCVVRPARHRRGQGLWVDYRALGRGRFRLRWLFYRSGR
jgi:hypothetical protein